MKLVFFTENYRIGGCDRFLADLVAKLDPERFEIALVGNRSPDFDEWIRRRLPRHVPRYEVGVSTLPSSTLVRRARPALLDEESGVPLHPPVARAGAATLRYAQAPGNYARLRAVFRQVRPDVLHINNGGYPGGETCRWAALAARAENGRGGIVHFVHNMAAAPDFPAPIERFLDKRIDRATDLWVTAAHRASSALHTARGIAPERIATVHYGIPVSPIASGKNETPVLAVVASFEPRKGHEILLDALRDLKHSGVALRTILVGDGERRDGLIRRTAKLGLESEVEFLGWRDDVPEILSKSDLLVLPSVGNECLPYAILEAMAQGLPVVATDVAGIPEEIVDGETGRIVPPGNSVALAEAIREVLADRIRARTMGERGRVRVATMFSLDRMVTRMAEMYLELGAAAVARR